MHNVTLKIHCLPLDQTGQSSIYFAFPLRTISQDNQIVQWG